MCRYAIGTDKRRSAAAAAALTGKIPNRIVSVDGGMGRLIDEGVQTVAL